MEDVTSRGEHGRATQLYGYSTAVKVRDVIRMLEEDGWRLVVTEGSHRQFKHPTKPGRVTVSGHLGDDMPKGTLTSVMRQAGIKRVKR